MENMSVADYLAIAERGGNDGVWGSGNGFLWVILIFLFFLGFSGNGLFGGRHNADSVQLTQVERDVLNGTCGTQKEVIESRYTTQLGLQNLQAQMSDCCCATQRAIDSVKAEAYKNTCDITNAIHAEGEATRALITSNTIQELRDNLQAAQLQLGNMSQTQAIVNQLQPVPRPAYLTCSPYAAYGAFGIGGYGCSGCNNCGNLV